MTDWKWVRLPGALHDRASGIRDEITAEQVQRARARTGIKYYEVIELALDALERERRHGVDVDHGRPGGIRGDAGRRDVDGVDAAGGT